MVNAIKGAGEDTHEETMMNNILRNLLPIYAIRVFSIQELKCTPCNDLLLDILIGRLSAFQLSNFDN